MKIALIIALSIALLLSIGCAYDDPNDSSGGVITPPASNIAKSVVKVQVIDYGRGIYLMYVPMSAVSSTEPAYDLFLKHLVQFTKDKNVRIGAITSAGAGFQYGYIVITTPIGQ